MGQGRKTVLITGSGRGIGQAAALYFAKQNPEAFHIVINNRSHPEELEKTRDQILAIPGASCLAAAADVGNYEECKSLFDRIRERFGEVDILINNAGVSYIGLFTDMMPGQWEAVMRTNLYSVFHCCHLAVPAMVQKKQGKIINISSVWGSAGASCEAVYSASKGGMEAFTRALAKELGPSNIQVNAIACGLMDTQMNRELSEADKRSLIEEIPACRMGSSGEAAALIYDLACGHEYLTGQVIRLDGGWI